MTKLRFLAKLQQIVLALLLGSMLYQESAFAARLKDLASIRGVRENQLVGYGVVVGLNGTGDSNLEYTNKSVKRMLSKLGMKVDGDQAVTGNVAAVIITATLPAFSKAGNTLDITVNSIGDAKSLRGGSLVQTPLRAANDQTYAVAQGSIFVGDEKAGHPTAGRIPGGAIIERDLSKDFASRKMFRLTLQNPDFTTAARMALTINNELGGHYATAKDAGTIDVITPSAYEGRGVELVAAIESIEINPDMRARVVINEKTGTVVIGDQVKISQVAISHGTLSVKVASGGQKGKKGKEEDAGDRLNMINGANVGDLVQSLNKLGATPKDLITILQSIKAAGALHGELEIL